MKYLVLVMLLISLAIVSADGVAPSGDGSETSPYEIATLENLEWISTNSSSWSSYFIQTADIDASDTENWNGEIGFSPIGNEELQFTGNYNGNDHSISGLYIDKPNKDYQGLFGYTYDATISHLTAINFDIEANDYVSCLVGKNENTVISDCEIRECILTGNDYIGTASGNMESVENNERISMNSIDASNNQLSGRHYIGSIAGKILDSQIDQFSVVNNELEGTNFLGGICGFICNTDTVNVILGSNLSVMVNTIEGENYIGGVFGKVQGSILEDVYSSDNEIDGKDYVGGFCGHLRNSNYNDDILLINVTSISNKITDGDDYIGGLTGWSENVLLKDLEISFGEIKGENYVGGLSGYNTVSFDSTYMNTIDNCSAIGRIDSDGDAVGGLIGYNSENSLIKNSFAEMIITAEGEYIGGLVGQFETEKNIPEEVENSFYNYEVMTVNEECLISVGALSNELYQSWKANEMNLNIDDHLSNDGEYYLIENVYDFTTLLAFGIYPELKFKLSSDINLMSYNDFYIPVFVGELLGDGYSISYLSIDVPGNSNLGLFGYVKSATIEDLDIIRPFVKGNNYLGSLTGYCIDSFISGVGVYGGNVTGQGDEIGGLSGKCENDTINSIIIEDFQIEGSNYVGGLTGYISNSSIIESHAQTILTAEETYSGGLFGECENSLIQNSSCQGIITGEGDYCGGLIGMNSLSEITNCVATGSVNTEGEYTGGLIGYNDQSPVNNCISRNRIIAVQHYVGGLIGRNIESEITDSQAERTIIATADYIGGLIGRNEDSNLTNVFAYGNVSGSGDYIGGLIGKNQASAIENAITTGEIIASGDYSGGLIGENLDSNISNSRSEGSLDSNGKYAGGIAGYCRNSHLIESSAWGNVISDDDYIGGLVGHFDTVDSLSFNISNCYSDGNVSGKRYTGGLIGKISSADNSSTLIETCYSQGDVTGINEYTGGLAGLITASEMAYTQINFAHATGEISGADYTGGLIGRAETVNDQSTISKSYYIGSVDGNYYVGGLIGSNMFIIDNSFTLGSVVGNKDVGGFAGLNDCSLLSYEAAKIIDSYTSSFVGGIKNTGSFIGRNEVISSEYSELENCVWNSNVSPLGMGYDYNNGMISLLAKTAEEMTDINTFVELGWDTDSCWMLNDINNGLPCLQGTEMYFNELNANFSANKFTADTNENIQFIDLSMGNIVSWNWDFDNDGIIDSYENDPEFSFSQEGFYSVCLSVSSADGSSESILFEHMIAVYDIPSGDGSEATPYEISTLGNLLWMSKNSISWDSHFIQSGNIDASETSYWQYNSGFIPIGSICDHGDVVNVMPFTGTYNGNNYAIENLYIDKPYTNYIGLFGYAEEAVFDSVMITGLDIRGNDYIGGLIGKNISSIVNNCQTEGYIEGVQYTGGISGWNTGASIINSCAADSIFGIDYCGGISGWNIETPVTDSHTNCYLEAENSVGGLIGYNNSLITGCYSSSKVNGEEYVGGLVGVNYSSTVTMSYANHRVSGIEFVGGLAGYANKSMINKSYAVCEDYEDYGDTLSFIYGRLNVGGIAGFLGEECEISDTFFIGEIRASNSVGGLVGHNENSAIYNSYVSGKITAGGDCGGLIGWNRSMITDCVWNMEIDGLIDSLNSGVGFNDIGSMKQVVISTTAAMQETETYTDLGWDFVDETDNGTEDIWKISENVNSGLPYIVALGRPEENIQGEDPEEEIIEYIDEMAIYPNPFNPVTNINFALETASDVRVSIFNIKGQKVVDLVNDFYEAGEYSVPWQADKVSSGIYLVRYNSDRSKEIRKITLLK